MKQLHGFAQTLGIDSKCYRAANRTQTGASNGNARRRDFGENFGNATVFEHLGVTNCIGQNIAHQVRLKVAVMTLILQLFQLRLGKLICK